MRRHRAIRRFQVCKTVKENVIGYKEDIKNIEVIGKAVEEEVQVLEMPLYLSRISAGFPSPADDYIESALDLNRFLVKNPPATFMVKVSGDSMMDAGIHNGDILVVDRAAEAIHGKIVVAVLDGELTVKRLHLKDNECMLIPENNQYKPIRIASEQELHIWGVVTAVIRRY